MPPPHRTFLSLHALATVLAMAAAYYAAGRLALLLAIPPGYASPVWPAAGIALAGSLRCGARAWPGIWLGSWLVNLSVPYDMTTLTSIALAASVGAGSALQAMVGAFLVRRSASFPSALAQARDVSAFLLLGGPVSCLISATLGVTTLVLGGALAWTAYPFSWWTWWVGDTIGVVVVTPLIFIWTASPLQHWRRRQLAVALPLAVLLCLVIVFFVHARAWEEQRIQLAFERRADTWALTLQQDFDDYLEVLQAIGSFFDSSVAVNRYEFHTFVQRALRRYPGIQALSWNPCIVEAEREAYEEAMRQEGHANFHITELQGQGQRVRAAQRSEYVPVAYIEPSKGNDSVLGYDVASNTTRLPALQRARDSGQPSATGMIMLVQESQEQAGILVFLPIYGRESAHHAMAEHCHNLQGYVTEAFRIGDVVDTALRAPGWEGGALQLYDITEPRSPELLYEYPRRAAGQSTQAFDMASGSVAAFSVTRTFDVAGRHWQLRFSPTPEYLLAQQTWYAWSELAAGLLFSGLLGAFLLVGTGYTASVERLVAERTAELAQANTALADEIAEHQRAAAALLRQTQELRRSNADLEQFTYAAAHDLQEPLRAVAGCLYLLRQHEAGHLNARSETLLTHAVDGAARMQNLVDGLLTYARAGASSAAAQPTDCAAVLKAALANLQVALVESGAVLTHDPLPTIQADATQLGQVFQNLLGNALKFRSEAPPTIHIGVERQADAWQFAVHDNGIGIEPQYAERIFAIFQRLHTRRHYPGTGIGLALCKKIVENHGGRIWVESVPGQGATFFFTIPHRS